MRCYSGIEKVLLGVDRNVQMRFLPVNDYCIDLKSEIIGCLQLNIDSYSDCLGVIRGKRGDDIDSCNSYTPVCLANW